jgi:hypothetical protein
MRAIAAVSFIAPDGPVRAGAVDDAVGFIAPDGGVRDIDPFRSGPHHSADHLEDRGESTVRAI